VPEVTLTGNVPPDLDQFAPFFAQKEKVIFLPAVPTQFLIQ